MSFYRIYRPQIIDEIDNVAARESLLELLTKPKKELPHAFLFTGPRGGGKTTTARLVAKLFNCEKPGKSGPCGVCSQCVSIAEGRNLDVLELDGASNRGIDEIRTLRDGIALSPAAAPYKIYIIDEVHMLTPEAFNALLKTLEEPPAHAIFILATTDPQKVPVTIRSRCMVFVFARANADELTSALARIVKKEKIAIDEDALLFIAQGVDGSFRDAVKLLEQASFHKGKITKETLETLLSLSTDSEAANFVGMLIKNDGKAAIDALDLIAQLVKKGVDLKAFITQCLQRLETMLVLNVTGKALDVATPEKQSLQLLIRKLSQAYTEMRTSPIPQLPLELAVVEYCQNEQREASNEKRATSDEKQKEISANPNDARNSKLEIATHQPASGSLTLDQLTSHWVDVIAELKPYNHSVAGVMRSTRPASVAHGIVTIEAFYTFHKDKLSETKTRENIAVVLKKLFGEKVKVEVVLGKK